MNAGPLRCRGRRPSCRSAQDAAEEFRTPREFPLLRLPAEVRAVVRGRGKEPIQKRHIPPGSGPSAFVGWPASDPPALPAV